MKKTEAAQAAETESALRAALALVQVIPSDVPLSVRPATAAEKPAGTVRAVLANFIGSPSADLVVLVDESIDLALEGAGGAAVSLADALRPALEAASKTLGSGVLGELRTGAEAEQVLAADDAHTFALESGDEIHGWFAIRHRAPLATPAAKAPVTDTDTALSNMRLLYDVEMTLTAEIGRARLPVRQVLDLAPGAVIELDRVAGSPADLMVNGRLIARGEVVVVDEVYGLRVTEIVQQGEASA